MITFAHVTLFEAASFLEVSERYVEALIEGGHLTPTLSDAGQRLIPRGQLLELRATLDENLRAAQGFDDQALLAS